MGTEERDWVQVANELLHKCHIKVRVTKLSDCDASVFVSLYEAVLSDKVPDFIAVPTSQEDDIHNVQSVIDSLALDYLHISLSHITGENIVQGDRESVRNLLEIFDGLLEYLTEQLSEDEEAMPNGVVGQTNGEVLGGVEHQAQGISTQEHEEKMSQASSAMSAVQSSKHSLFSWNGEDSESTAELIRLGDSARTFSKKEAVLSALGTNSQRPSVSSTAHVALGPALTAINVSTSADAAAVHTPTTGVSVVIPGPIALPQEPSRTAIPLQPPFQTSAQRLGPSVTSSTGAATKPTVLGLPLTTTRSPHSASHSPESGSASPREQPSSSSLQNGYTLRPTAGDLHSRHLLSTSSHRSPVTSEKSASSQRKTPRASQQQSEQTATVATAAREAVSSPPVAAPRRVLFRSQPEVLLDSLREELEAGPLLHNGHALEPRLNGDTYPSERREVEEEEVEEDPRENLLSPSSSSSWRRRRMREHGQPKSGRVRVDQEEHLSRRSQRNRRAEQELHDMSEKLSRRLEELDLMLKRALGESGQVPEEDEHSQQSDDEVVTQTRRLERATDVPLTNGVGHSRSPSTSPPARRSLLAQLRGEGGGGVGVSKPQQSAARPCQRDVRHPHRHRWRGQAQMLGQAYEEELRRYEEEERAKMAAERLHAQETEREYKQALRKDASRSPKSVESASPKTSGSQGSSHGRHAPSSRKQPQALPRSHQASPMRLKENDLLPTLLEEFPGVHLSPHALGRMWKQQMRQVDHLNAPENQRSSRIKMANEVEAAQRRHDLLVEIIRKEQEHNRRLREQRERVQQQKSAQNQVRERRQQVARAKKYYSDYHLQLRARLARARTQEEKLFKRLFEEGVELQRERLREERAYVKEQRQEHQRKHRIQLEAMEHYYKDQLALLAETLAQEREDIQVRKKAQEKALHKLKRELRSKMEREIRELQRLIIQNDEDDYFQNLEAQRLRSRLHMASFQYNTSGLH